MKIGRIQNQITNSNLVRNVKKVVKPAVLTAAVALGGLAAGGCTSNKEYREPRFHCEGCDYVVYPGTDLNVAHETLYKQFDLAKNKYDREYIMESAALLEIADENCDEIISAQELRNLRTWDLFHFEKDNTMSLDYMNFEKDYPHSLGIDVRMSPEDLPKCKIDNKYFIFDNKLKISKQGEIRVDIKKSGSGYEVEISHRNYESHKSPEPSYITIYGNDIKYLKISNTRISEISIVDRTKDLNIDLVNVKGEKRSPVSVFKDNTKSHININAVDSKYEFSSID